MDSFFEYVLMHAQKNTRDSIARAVSINIQNVWEYYSSHMSEFTRVKEDFPNIAPPWPRAFFEYRTPIMGPNDTVVGSMNIGVLVDSNLRRSIANTSAEELERIARLIAISGTIEESTKKYFEKSPDSVDPDKYNAVKDIIAQNVYKEPGKIWAALGVIRQEACRNTAIEYLRSIESSKIKWESVFIIYVSGKVDKTDFGPFEVAHSAVGITAEGGIQLSISGDDENHWPLRLYPDNVNKIPIDGYKPEDFIRWLYPVFLAISFSHCKNVEVVDSRVRKVPPRLRKMMSLQSDTVVTKVLKINPITRILESEGDIGNSGIKTALHTCRGHFRDYRERGLFGRTRGVFWFDQHVRGTNMSRVVHKSYKVEGPSK